MTDGDHFGVNLDVSVIDLEALQRVRRSIHEAIRGLQTDLDNLRALHVRDTGMTSPKWASNMISRLANELERSRMLSTSLDDTVALVMTMYQPSRSQRLTLVRFAPRLNDSKSTKHQRWHDLLLLTLL